MPCGYRLEVFLVVVENEIYSGCCVEEVEKVGVSWISLNISQRDT